MFLDRLIEWEFDEQRTKTLEQRENTKTKLKRSREKLRDRLLLHRLGAEDYREYIRIHIPLFPEEIPSEILDLYGIIREVVSVAHNGFSLSGRESMSGMEAMVERRGYMAVPFAPYIRRYESAMLEFHNKDAK